MQAFLFRIFGILTLLFGVGLVCIVVLTLPRLEAYGPSTNTEILRIVALVSLSFGVGIGLLFLRRWAAIIVSLATSAYAAWLIIETSQGVPIPYCLINYAFGMALLFPIIATIGFWSTLKPGGRYYL